MDLFVLEELVIVPMIARFGDIGRAFLYLTVGETDGSGPPGGDAGA